MNNIFKAFNVTSQKEFDTFIESLELNDRDSINLFTELNEEKSVELLRNILLEVSSTFGNGAYEKLEKQFKKEPFKRTLKEMSISHDQYKKLKIGSKVKFDPENVRVHDDGDEEISDKSDDKITTITKYPDGKKYKSIYKPEVFKSNYSTIEENEVQDRGGATEILWNVQDLEHNYALCDVDGVIQWCFVTAENKDNKTKELKTINVEPLDEKVYGTDKIPQYSVKAKNIIKFATPEEEKKLDNGELQPFVSFGKSFEKEPGVGYSEYNKGTHGRQQVKEGKDIEIDLGRILSTMKGVVANTNNVALLKKFYKELEIKSANAKNEDDLIKINEMKKVIQDRYIEIQNIGKEDVNECFTYDTMIVPSFNDIGVDKTMDAVFNDIKPANVEINITYKEEPNRNQAVQDLLQLASFVDGDEEPEDIITIENLLNALHKYFEDKIGE